MSPYPCAMCGSTITPPRRGQPPIFCSKACRNTQDALTRLEKHMAAIPWGEGEAGARKRAMLRSQLWSQANTLNARGPLAHREGGKRGTKTPGRSRANLER